MNTMTTRASILLVLLILAAALVVGGCDGVIADPSGMGPTTDGPSGSETTEECEGCVGASPLHRLLREEAIGVMQQTFGPAELPYNLLPGNAVVGLFETNHLAIEEQGVRAHNQFAEAAATRLAADSGCSDRACAVSYLRDKATLLFRRAPTEEELATFVNLLDEPAGVADWSLEDGIRLALSALLQAPQFIYEVEVGRPGAAEDAPRPLSGLEVATRLSLLLWREGPSPELAEAAARGELDSAEGVARHARVLLESPRSDATIRSFFGRLFELQEFGEQARYSDGNPDAESYPGLPALTEDMREETDAFVVALMRTTGSFRELYTADYTYASDALAEYYGARPGALVDASPLPRVQFDGSEGRSGILTHGAVIGANTTVEEYRAAHRGRFVLENLLCQDLPSPPPLDAIPTADEGVSPRMRFESLTDSPVCQSCHGLMNPAGFLFEHFDAGAAYTDSAEGFAVDASGGLPAVGMLVGTRDLGEALAQSEAAQLCMARRWFQFALGRYDGATDQHSVAAALEAFRESDLDMRELVIGLVASDAFRHRQLPN